MTNDAIFNPYDVDFISYTGVSSLLLDLKTKTSCGPDNIPTVFLRRYAEILEKCLVAVFRATLRSAQLPEDRRMVRVVPILKKGVRLSIENCRPIFLTTSCCNVIEHIIYQCIMNIYKNTHS